MPRDERHRFRKSFDAFFEVASASHQASVETLQVSGRNPASIQPSPFVGIQSMPAVSCKQRPPNKASRALDTLITGILN